MGGEQAAQGRAYHRLSHAACLPMCRPGPASRLPPCPPVLQVAGLDTSSALGAFEKMEEKVMALEAQAEAALMVS